MINVTATAGIAIITAKRVLTGTNSIHATYRDLFSTIIIIIIISFGDRNQEHEINLSLLNST